MYTSDLRQWEDEMVMAHVCWSQNQYIPRRIECIKQFQKLICYSYRDEITLQAKFFCKKHAICRHIVYQLYTFSSQIVVIYNGSDPNFFRKKPKLAWMENLICD